MRHLVLLGGLLLSSLLASDAGAQAPPQVVLKVGASKQLGGCAGRCDDTAVVSITLDCNAILTALRPGRTLCSTETRQGTGLRKVVEVVVEP